MNFQICDGILSRFHQTHENNDENRLETQFVVPISVIRFTSRNMYVINWYNRLRVTLNGDFVTLQYSLWSRAPVLYADCIGWASLRIASIFKKSLQISEISILKFLEIISIIFYFRFAGTKSLIWNMLVLTHFSDLPLCW